MPNVRTKIRAVIYCNKWFGLDCVVEIGFFTRGIFQKVSIRVQVKRLALLDCLKILFLTFSYGLAIFLRELSANWKQRLCQFVVLREVFISDLIGFSVNLSEVKRLGLELGKEISSDRNTEYSRFDNFLFRRFGFDFEFGQVEVPDSVLNEIFALFLP